MGGIESYVMNIYRHIDQKKVQFDFAIFKKDNFFEEEAERLGARVYKCLDGSYKVQLKFVEELQLQNNYPIVHCHNCSLKGMIRGTLPVRRLKNDRPLIIAHSHNPGMPTNTAPDKIIRYVLKKIITESSDYYFACSQEASNSKFLPSKAASRYILLKNGIEVKKFAFDPKIRKKFEKNWVFPILLSFMGLLVDLKRRKIIPSRSKGLLKWQNKEKM